ncbi:MAG: hypothetical protein IIB57_12860 [Planctomycetes bacterium]|nr:hypothetical protein [Planctomycetota bacterium]
MEWIPSDRTAMEGEVLDAITFWDDVSRYNLVLHQDGAVLVDIRAQTVTNSFAFNVGPVPTVKDPDKVFIAALGAMARRNRNSGTFDMEVGELTSETAMDALERSDAAAVFLNSGTVVALFFVDSEVNAILLFSPQDHSGVEDGGTREALTPQDEHDMACTVLFEECTLRRNVQACAFWLQLCDTT